MVIAVLSGKGGTGKTLLSVNLSYLAKKSMYIDCDVEEPNGLLYYQMDKQNKESVYVDIPVIDHSKCDGCRKCTDFCKFNALAYINGRVRLYDDLCHSCGGCSLVCPLGAITETKKEIGSIVSGTYESTSVYSGEMIVGEESGVPIIKALLSKIQDKNQAVFIDSPPGNGCTVMESISEADYCVLVAEPSIFGLHNLNMVYHLAKVFNKKMGLVINKATESKIINDYAEENDIKILGEIPMDLTFGKFNSEGYIVAKKPEYKPLFENILNHIFEEVKK